MRNSNPYAKPKPKDTNSNCVECGKPIKDFAALLGDGKRCTACHGPKFYVHKSKKLKNETNDLSM